MGRALRSGRHIASLSPPNKRKDDAKGKAQPKAAAPAMPRANAARTKGASNTSASQKANAKRSTLNYDTIGNSKKTSAKPQPKEESSDSDDDEVAMVEQKIKAGSREVAKKTVVSSSAQTPKKSNNASTTANREMEDSSEEEESEEEDEDNSDDESDDEIKKVSTAPLKRSSHLTSKNEKEESSVADSDDDSDEDSSNDSNARDKGFTDGMFLNSSRLMSYLPLYVALLTNKKNIQFSISACRECKLAQTKAVDEDDTHVIRR